MASLESLDCKDGWFPGERVRGQAQRRCLSSGLKDEDEDEDEQIDMFDWIVRFS
jgi:hypothetical protein